MAPRGWPAAWLGLVFAVTACSAGRDASAAAADLSEFVVDSLVSGRVLENSTACTVDADCYLRIEFADTSIVGLYGTGERPAPACEISRAVSDVAFHVARGERVNVVISTCGADGHYLRRLERDGG